MENHRGVRFLTFTSFVAVSILLCFAVMNSLKTVKGMENIEAVSGVVQTENNGGVITAVAEVDNKTENREIKILDTFPLGQIDPITVGEEPSPAPHDTPVKPYYDKDGKAPQAPGLAMRDRRFAYEPQKVVYLTFDDGPYPEVTEQILDILANEGVRATFFVLGSQAEKYPDLLKKIYLSGHSIGNHSYSHDYGKLYWSIDSFMDEIMKTDDIIYSITGIRPRIVRAPGGSSSYLTVEHFNRLDQKDFLVYDWNVSSGDAAGTGVPADQILNNVISQMEGLTKGVILMHDSPGKKTTVEALPQIIQYLKAQGYAFGTLTPEIRPVLFSGAFYKY